VDPKSALAFISLASVFKATFLPRHEVAPPAGGRCPPLQGDQALKLMVAVNVGGHGGVAPFARLRRPQPAAARNDRVASFRKPEAGSREPAPADSYLLIELKRNAMASKSKTVLTARSWP
jgi:hypothetical protein